MSKKYRQSETDVEVMVGSDSGETFNQSEPDEEKKVEKNKSKKEKKVRITFKENRAFELHIGREIYRFSGRESKVVPASLLEHKDFTEQTAMKFVVVPISEEE